MYRVLLRAKVHRATVTEANLDYEGSITLDQELMEAAALLPFEQVHVLNLNTGARLETYVIPGQPGSGIVCLNGAAARLGAPGDKVIILSYGLYTEEEAQRLVPRVVRVGEDNRPLSAEQLAER